MIYSHRQLFYMLVSPSTTHQPQLFPKGEVNSAEINRVGSGGGIAYTDDILECWVTGICAVNEFAESMQACRILIQYIVNEHFWHLLQYFSASEISASQFSHRCLSGPALNRLNISSRRCAMASALSMRHLRTVSFQCHSCISSEFAEKCNAALFA